MVASVFRHALRVLLGAGVILALVLCATSVAAPSRELKARAKRYVADGIVAQQAGRYDEAISLYTFAHELIPHPELLFNLGQAHRMRGDKPAALRYYREYLAAEPTGRAAQESTEWATQIEAELKAQAEAEAARLAEEARAAEQARQMQLAREAEAARAAAAHRAEGERAARLAIARQRESEEWATRWSFRRKLALGLGGLAIASLGTAAALELSGMRSLEKYDERPWGPRGDELYDTANDKHLVAQYLAAAGLVCGGAAAYLWITGKRSPAARTARFAPVVSSQSAGFVFAGGF